MIDITNLNPYLSRKGVEEYIKEVEQFEPRGIVLNYSMIPLARKFLKNKNTKLVTVFGYPFKNSTGALYSDFDEIDVVIPIVPYYAKNDLDAVKKFIDHCINKVKGRTIKVILETSLVRIRETQLKELVGVCVDKGIDYIKTNTGLFKFQVEEDIDPLEIIHSQVYGFPKSRLRTFDDLLQDVKFIKDHCNIPVKASGGIRTLSQVIKLKSLGVSIIGTSSIELLKQYHERFHK